MNDKIEKIRELIGQDKLREALSELRNSSTFSNNEIIIHSRRLEENKKQFQLGQINREDFSVGNTRIALALLELIDDSFRDNKSNLSQLFLKFGRQRMSSEDFVSAKMYFDKAIIEDYSLIEAYVDRGAAKLALNQYQEAIPDFTMAIKHDSNNGIALYNRGVSYFQAGQLEDACEDWKKVKELGLNIADEVLDLCVEFYT